MGRSPQDVEDQITYPLTVALLGMPGVKTVRSYSHVRLLEHLRDLQGRRGLLLVAQPRAGEAQQPAGRARCPRRPAGARARTRRPWGRSSGTRSKAATPDGKPAGGWDLEELRTIQDWYVRYGLQSAEGVSEVASVGGFVREYQVDVDPDAMRAYGVTLPEVFAAVKGSNIDVGARSIEVNRVEYFIRGIGFIKSVSDIEDSVIKVNDNVPDHASSRWPT